MGKKILLADDSITIQKVIELTFSDEDFEVVTVGNGRLAIERVQEVRPDLVLCDIIMPEKDGYEVCDFIKKNPALSHIPVLLLTGAFEPFDQERAARVGCDGFLAKPFEPQTLIAKVKDLLEPGGVPARGGPGLRRAAAAPAPVSAIPPAASAPPPAAPSSLDDEPSSRRRAGARARADRARRRPRSLRRPVWPRRLRRPGPSRKCTSSRTSPTSRWSRRRRPRWRPRRSTTTSRRSSPSRCRSPSRKPSLSRSRIPEPPIAAAPRAGAGRRPGADVPRARLLHAARGGRGRGGEELAADDARGGGRRLRPGGSQPTVEVPLEVRAQASVEAAQEPAEEPFFEEVFEAEPEPPPVYVPPAPPPAAPPPAPMPMASILSAPEPERIPPPEPPAPYELEQTLVEDAETVLEGVRPWPRPTPPSRPPRRIGPRRSRRLRTPSGT